MFHQEDCVCSPFTTFVGISLTQHVSVWYSLSLLVQAVERGRGSGKDSRAPRRLGAGVSRHRSKNIFAIMFATAKLIFDPRVEKGRKSVYRIARKLQKNCSCTYVPNSCEKLYAKILLKNIENDNDNFETVAIELE